MAIQSVVPRRCLAWEPSLVPQLRAEAALVEETGEAKAATQVKD